MSEDTSKDPALFEAEAASVRTGDFVIYRDSEGHQKSALVTGDPQTIEADTRVPELSGTARHLTVFGPRGSVYSRESIPAGDGPHTWSPRA